MKIRVVLLVFLTCLNCSCISLIYDVIAGDEEERMYAKTQKYLVEKEEMEYNEALAQDTYYGYTRFLDRFPEGIHSSQAQEHINTIMDERLEIAKESNLVIDLERFIRNNRDEEYYIQLAIESIDTILQEMIDEADQTKSVEDYENIIKVCNSHEYADDSFIDYCKEQIDLIETERDRIENALRAERKVIWESSDKYKELVSLIPIHFQEEILCVRNGIYDLGEISFYDYFLSNPFKDQPTLNTVIESIDINGDELRFNIVQYENDPVTTIILNFEALNGQSILKKVRIKNHRTSEDNSTSEFGDKLVILAMLSSLY